jgi:S1-C subfamily serine protease
MTTWFALFALLTTPAERPPAAEFSRAVRSAAVAATVRIVNESDGSEGSGVLLRRQGKVVYVLTAHHLVRKAGRLAVTVYAAGPKPRFLGVYREAEVVAVTPDARDLALIRLTVDGKGPGTLALCPPQDVPDKGDFRALAVGCEEDVPTCVAVKVLGKKQLRREAKGKSAWFWEVEGKHAQGRSGGPLVDRHGRLLGVLSGTSNGNSYFTHPDEIRMFLKIAGVTGVGE